MAFADTGVLNTKVAALPEIFQENGYDTMSALCSSLALTVSLG